MKLRRPATEGVSSGFLLFLPRSLSIQSEGVGMPSEEEVDLFLRKFGVCLRPEPLPKDQRRCCFCNQQGDGQTDGPARLLNLDLDLWVSVPDPCWDPPGTEQPSTSLRRTPSACVPGPPQLCPVVERGLRDPGRRPDQRGAGAEARADAPLRPLSADRSHQRLQPLPLH